MRVVVAVEDVSAGDSVFIDHVGLRTVSAVEEDAPGEWTIVYFAPGETAWEGSARGGRRASATSRLIEKQLAWMPAGAPVEVVRGNPRAAERLRGEVDGGVRERMVRQQARRQQWADGG